MQMGNLRKKIWIIIVIGMSGIFTTVLGQEIGQPVRETPAQLQQLVAPIALYPDKLVAQVLTASTYPTQIVEADRWLGMHSDLQGEQLAAEVDQQPPAPSVALAVIEASLTIGE